MLKRPWSVFSCLLLWVAVIVVGAHLWASGGCSPTETSDLRDCAQLCAPAGAFRIAREVGSFTCECGVLPDNKRYDEVTDAGGKRYCGGRPVVKVTVTGFGYSDVTCAP